LSCNGQVYAKAREEFLNALEEEMDKWVETPDEAKFVSISLSLTHSLSLLFLINFFS
jgi:hypothetical protein